MESGALTAPPIWAVHLAGLSRRRRGESSGGGRPRPAGLWRKIQSGLLFPEILGDWARPADGGEGPRGLYFQASVNKGGMRPASQQEPLREHKAGVAENTLHATGTRQSQRQEVAPWHTATNTSEMTSPETSSILVNIHRCSLQLLAMSHSGATLQMETCVKCTFQWNEWMNEWININTSTRRLWLICDISFCWFCFTGTMNGWN